MSYHQQLGIGLKILHKIIQHPKVAGAAATVFTGLAALGAATLAGMARK